MSGRNVWILGIVAAIIATFPAAASPNIAQASSSIESELNGLVSYSEQPKWVTPAGVDTHATFLADSVLFDTQVKLENTGYTLYRRHATRLGVTVAQTGTTPLLFALAPGKESLQIHDVVIWRNGVAHDAIETLTLKVNRPASNTPSYTPYTVQGTVNGVEPGDILDWSVSWSVATPDWPKHFYHEFFTDWAVPSLHDRTRILTPRDRELTIIARGAAPAPQISRHQDTTEYLWERREIVPTSYVQHVPADVFIFSSVSVSTAKTWQDVAEWGVDRYRPSTEFTAEINAEIARRKTMPLADRATWAIRFVQDEIPYDHQRFGLSTHIARTPRETLLQARGDCKDKALLLVSMLHALGINATVALTDMDEGVALPYRAPSAYAFDHAIVRIDTEYGTTFIDPTRAYQGGRFPNIEAASFGYALPLVVGASLEAMKTPKRSTPTLATVEAFDFSGEDFAGMVLKTVTTRSGIDADTYRHQLAQVHSDTLITQYAEYYRTLYPGIHPIGDLSIIDDRDANTIIVTERYGLPKSLLTTATLAAFPLQAKDARWEQLNNIETDRQFALSLENTGNSVHTIEILGVAGLTPTVNSYVHDSSSLAFSRTAATLPDGMSVTLRITAKTAAVETADFPTLAPALSAFRDQLSFTADLSAYAERSFAAAQNHPADPRYGAGSGHAWP